MKKSRSSKNILVIVLVVIVLLASIFIFISSRNGNILGLSKDVNENYPLNLDILNNLKISYSDSWSITNNGTQGVELTKGDVTILLTTAKIENKKTLDEIVDSRKEVLKSSRKILSDTKFSVNGISFRRLELGSQDETLFPSDGFISYSAVVNTDVYLTLIVNFPSGGNPKEAEGLINTIRYN